MNVTPSRRVLAEDYLPIQALGIEGKRERKVFTDLPPLYYLHIWWARRPIVVSEGVVLASLLPAWSPDLAERFSHLPQVTTQDAYQAWLLHLVGIVRDPQVGAARERDGVAKGKAAFGYPQAWKNSPRGADVEALHEVLRWRWDGLPTVCDPTAGGGAIPFAALRFGLPTIMNDLNGVAAAVQHGGVVYPATQGAEPGQLADQYAARIPARLDEELKSFFPSQPHEHLAAFLYTYTIPAPRTELPIPLLPNLWLQRGSRPVAVDIVPTGDARGFEIRVLHGADVDPRTADAGTMQGGDVLDPYDEVVLPATYIKEQIAARRMKPVLYAVATRSTGGSRRAGPLVFRAPTAADLEGVRAAEDELAYNREDWERRGFLPTEDFPPPVPKHDIRPWGFHKMQDFFSARQLVTHATFVRVYAEIAAEVRAELPTPKQEAVLVLLGLMHGKMLDYNSRHSAWNINQQSVQHTFESHGFGFKSTFAEKMTPGDLMRWAASQVVKAYRVSAELIEASRRQEQVAVVRAGQGNAGDLANVLDGEVACLCIDPPYYENVMYGELADFFYVWHKRTIGQTRPDWFPTELSDTDNEAVANVSKFTDMGKRKTELADADYEAKMTAIFAECHRVLRADGVMTVMFTHKRSDAWDKLGVALIAAGFTVETSWPVNTEFEYSKHQANLAAASSTVMLVCRKRPERAADAPTVYLEDIEADIRNTAVDAVAHFRELGISGVDLLLSAYGPTLSVVSRNWPVEVSSADESGRSRLLRPEEALSIARREITRVQRTRLTGSSIQFDAATDFTLTFWDNVKASGTSYDDARKLANAVGVDIDQMIRDRVAKKEGGILRLLEPRERVVAQVDQGGVRPGATKFSSLIDALHTVCYVLDEDGAQRAWVLMESAQLLKDARFTALIQAMVRAVPRDKTKGAFLQPLAGSLDRLCVAYLPEIELPPEQDLASLVEQGDLFADPSA